MGGGGSVRRVCRERRGVGGEGVGGEGVGGEGWEERGGRRGVGGEGVGGEGGYREGVLVLHECRFLVEVKGEEEEGGLR